MVDYVAVERLNERQLREIAIGLEKGARQAHISVPGGELAQVPEMIRGAGENGEAFDLVGTAVGVVPLDRIVTGERAQPGDVLVGFPTSGIHSNGLTLARKVLLDDSKEWSVGTHVAELGRTIGEELLEPTLIYVDLALELLRRCDVRALFHITGDGFLNLRRIAAPVGFEIEALPPVPAIFELIQRTGGIDDPEMYRVFNMGVGFAAVVPAPDAAAALAVPKDLGIDAWVLGRCAADESKAVHLRPLGLVGTGGEFELE
jgi:phosphoribosylformylglycinamidine cyclo-ligase